MYNLIVTTDDYSVEPEGPGSIDVASASLVTYDGLGGLMGLPEQALRFSVDDSLGVELTCERNVQGEINFSIMHDRKLHLMATFYGPFSMRVFAKDEIDYVVELIDTEA